MTSPRGLVVRMPAWLCALGAAWLCALGGIGMWSAAPARALPAVLLESESVSNVTSTSATLEATVNPLGSATTIHFQYGTTDCAVSPGSCTDVPVDAGSGEAPQTRATHINGLMPATHYNFRVLATNTLGSAEGAQQAFTTEPPGADFSLPDGRVWEMVSPPNKHGGTIPAIEEGGMVIQAAEDGSRFTFLTFSPTEEEPDGNTNGVQILADRASQGGWSAKDIATPHEQAVGVSIGAGQEYRMFSADLAQAIVQPFGHTPLAENVFGPNPSRNGAYQTTYKRDNATGLFEPLVTKEDVAPTAKYGNAAFVGANPSLGSIVFWSDEPLTTESSEPGGLFVWRAGHLKLIARQAGLGDGLANLRNAVSGDGTRVVWTEPGEYGRLYETDLATGVTVNLDESQGGNPAQPQRRAAFQVASADATKVFFSDGEPLTSDAHGGRDLYERDLEGGRLTDMTASLNAGEDAGVQGVLGASEDGSRIYFVATGALASGATAGEYNFYEAQDTGSGWSVSFVTTVSSGDLKDWQAGFQALANVTSRVSPDGRHLAFMSERPLTGYDNRDAASGQRDEEVFVYTGGRLDCVSCDPTGARPQGRLDQGTNLDPVMIDQPHTWGGRWLAANIPGWTGYSLISAEYQSRYLDDSGRLFFNSIDPLVPQDTNGKADVYEFEPAGVGSCKQAEGCISLVSSGTSNEESAFLDASANGDDVFFLTLGRLTPEDADTALDVYDAHVCSESARCTRALPAPPPCATADGCRAAPTPPPAIYGAPASATFSGAGNVTPVQAPAQRAKRVKKRSHRSASCKRKPRRKRASCKRRARQGATHTAIATQKGNR